MAESTSTSAPAEETTETAMNAAFIKRLKIAVATTIIRNKPTHVSAREYAQNLARRLRQKENNWQDRVRKLEGELLKARQELTVSRLQEAGVDVNIEEDFDWNEGGTNDGQVTDHASDGSKVELAFPTPPCSSEDNLPTNHGETTLKNNALFLHSIAQLQSIPECHRSDFNETMLKTALSAVGHVKDFAVDNCHGPWNHGKMLKKAVKGIVGLFEIEGVGNTGSLLDACERLSVRLLDSLLAHGDLNNNGYQQTLCHLVTTLGHINQLQLPILQAILNHLKRVSTMLRRTQEGKQDLDHVLYENTFYICSIFEDIILDQGGERRRQETTGCERRFKSKLQSDAIVSLHEGLEHCLLHISREYPLFAQFIWRLTGALECLEIDS